MALTVDGPPMFNITIASDVWTNDHEHFEYNFRSNTTYLLGFKYRTALVTQVYNATRMHVYLLPLAGALCKVAYERASALVTAVDFLRVDMVVVWKKESMDDFGRLCQQSPMGTPVLMAIARVARLSKFLAAPIMAISLGSFREPVSTFDSRHCGPLFLYAHVVHSTYRAYVWVCRPDGKYNG